MNGQSNGVFCPKCGAAIQPGKMFCTNCGTKIEAPNVGPTQGPAQGPAFNNMQNGVPNNGFNQNPNMVPPMRNNQPVNNQFNPNMRANGGFNGMPPMQQPKKKKGGKIALILIPVILVLLILIGVGVFNHLLKSGYLYEHGQLVTIYEKTGKCLQHHFKEATCTEPETCEICGTTQGEAKGHEWEAATCTEPETCSVCGETQGEALGHTCRLGVCDRCGEYQDELADQCEDIITNVVTAEAYFESFLTHLSYYDSNTYEGYYDATRNDSDLKSAYEYYKAALDACGEDEEFAAIKEALQTIVDDIPTTRPSYSKDSIEAHYNAVGEAYDDRNAIVEAAEDLADLLED